LRSQSLHTQFALSFILLIEGPSFRDDGMVVVDYHRLRCRGLNARS